MLRSNMKHLPQVLLNLLWPLAGPLPLSSPNRLIKFAPLVTTMLRSNPSILSPPITCHENNELGIWNRFFPRHSSNQAAKWLANAVNARKSRSLHFFVLFPFSLIRKRLKKDVVIVAETTTCRRHIEANHKVHLSPSILATKLPITLRPNTFHGQLLTDLCQCCREMQSVAKLKPKPRLKLSQHLIPIYENGPSRNMSCLTPMPVSAKQLSNGWSQLTRYV